jgi:hypothetical protein
MSTIVTLRGSWGDLRVHRETGFIVEYDDHGRRGWSPEDEGYHDIALIDPRTLIDPSLDTCGEADVLSAGGWTRDGTYFGSMTWIEDAVVDPDGTVWGDWLEVPLLPPPAQEIAA